MFWKQTTGNQTFIYNTLSLWNKVSANILCQCLGSHSGPIYLVWQILTPSLRSILSPSFFIGFVSLPAACMSCSYHHTFLTFEEHIKLNLGWLIFYRFHPEPTPVELSSGWCCILWFSHVNLINKMATHQAAPSCSQGSATMEGAGEDDVTAATGSDPQFKRLMLDWNTQELFSQPNHSFKSI